MSKNESPGNLSQIAFERWGVAALGGRERSWNHEVPGYQSQPLPNVSAPIHLEAGMAYYVEAMAQAENGNALGVAWRIPGQPAPREGDSPIPGAYLAILGNPQETTLTIVEQPQSVDVSEGQPGSFTVKATASRSGIYFQWRRNGTKILGANGSSFIVSEPALGESGDRYDCVLTRLSLLAHFLRNFSKPDP